MPGDTDLETKKNNMIFAEERRTKILELVKKQKKVTVPDLCNLYNVSSATIRGDLRELQQSGLLTRTHGGAIEKTQTGFELDATQKKIQNLAEKQMIAQIALNLIEDGDKIILDTGTTVFELAKLLNKKKNLTVLTNDIVIARTLEDFDRIRIILMGGILRKHFHCTVGIQGKEICTDLIVDKAFMGANCLSLANGATTPDIDQAETKKTMISITNKRIILCDASKIGKVSFARFATIEHIDTLITDKISKDEKHKFENNGVEVLVASSAEGVKQTV